MDKISSADDIWILSPTKDDLDKGASYAAISLPWTFNRMMHNKSSRGQQKRGLNIAKGIVGQEVLKRKLNEEGVDAPVQVKSHRDEDLFDFEIITSQGTKLVDLKSVNYYSDYDPMGREPFSPELLMKNKNYPGPDWRHFFPMLVPHTQIGQDKEAYIFAIAESVDFRSDPLKNRSDHYLTAYPYKELMPFLSSNRLCLAREEAGKGIYLYVEYTSDALMEPDNLIITGEWDGKEKIVEVELVRNERINNIGPFSCVSSFQVSYNDYENIYGDINIGVSKNTLEGEVLNTTRRNLNNPRGGPIKLRQDDFCNLYLPDDYTMYYVGWIGKEEFLQESRKYEGWVWPDDEVNEYENQPWSQLTESDIKKIERHGFEDCISTDPTRLHAGWMKTTGYGGGACCYYYPNIHGGGIRETNLYVLAQDLYKMDDLSEIIN